MLFFVYKSKPPKNMPKVRKYVDPGSYLFHPGMKNVPVLAPKWHAFVSGEVRERSLQSMAGIPYDEDEEELEKATRLKQLEEDRLDLPGHENRPNEPKVAEAATQAATIQHVQKRKLYKVISGSEVHWFRQQHGIGVGEPAYTRERCRPSWLHRNGGQRCSHLLRRSPPRAHAEILSGKSSGINGFRGKPRSSRRKKLRRSCLS